MSDGSNKSSGDNGSPEAAARADLSPEEASAFEALLEAIAAEVGLFAQHLPPEIRMQLVAHVLKESEELQRVVHDGTDPATVQKYGCWGVDIVDKQNNRNIPLRAPKRLQDAQTAQEVVGFVVILALLSSPVVRSVLQAHGFFYNFAQAPIQALDALRQQTPLVSLH